MEKDILCYGRFKLDLVMEKDILRYGRFRLDLGMCFAYHAKM
jgi:hypothetical protein